MPPPWWVNESTPYYLPWSTTRNPAVDVIIDTDMSIDVDDVGALCLAHGLADAGELNILAIVHNTGVDSGISAVGVINHYYGRHVPLGAYRGDIGRPGLPAVNSTGLRRAPGWTDGGRGPYVDELVRLFPSQVTNFSQVPDALSVYLSTLEAAADNSVVIISIGMVTNLLDLLQHDGSAPDSSSGLSLVHRKVSTLIAMGGRYHGGHEWNFAADGWGGSNPSAGVYAGVGETSHRFMQLWPRSVPIYFLPAETGAHVWTGAVPERPEDSGPEESPCRLAYTIYCGPGNGRSSWDLMAVLFAARGNSRRIYAIEQGSLAIYADGESGRWNISGGNNFAILATEDTEGVGEVMDAMLHRSPENRPSPPPPPPFTPCEPWCADNTQDWVDKCNFRFCYTCGQCAPPPVSPLPSPPPEPPSPPSPPSPPPVAPPLCPPPPSRPPLNPPPPPQPFMPPPASPAPRLPFSLSAVSSSELALGMLIGFLAFPLCMATFRVLRAARRSLWSPTKMKRALQPPSIQVTLKKRSLRKKAKRLRESDTDYGDGDPDL